MDRANAIFIADPENEALLKAGDAGGAAEPYFDVFLAMQKRDGHRRLDQELMDLVTERAAEFAALTPREQAALAWVEAVISTGKSQAADGAYAALKRHFDDAAIAKLTALAGTASARAKLGVFRRD